jgi:hypothetical protein
MTTRNFCASNVLASIVYFACFAFFATNFFIPLVVACRARLLVVNDLRVALWLVLCCYL